MKNVRVQDRLNLGSMLCTAETDGKILQFYAKNGS
jgi:hypothetical protein